MVYRSINSRWISRQRPCSFSALTRSFYVSCRCHGKSDSKTLQAYRSLNKDFLRDEEINVPLPLANGKNAFQKGVGVSNGKQKNGHLTKKENKHGKKQDSRYRKDKPIKSAELLSDLKSKVNNFYAKDPKLPSKERFHKDSPKREKRIATPTWLQEKVRMLEDKVKRLEMRKSPATLPNLVFQSLDPSIDNRDELTDKDIESLRADRTRLEDDKFESMQKLAPPIEVEQITVNPITVEGQKPVATLEHDLDRVLFNPGVHFVQDPRSRVYNFSPYLQKLMSVNDFDFSKLAAYVTSSKHTLLRSIAEERDLLYVGSTSTMSSTLCHYHSLISKFRPFNLEGLSRAFDYPGQEVYLNPATLAPASIFLRYRDGKYAIDSDKSFSYEQILTYLGRSMERLLISPESEYEKFRMENSHLVDPKLKEESETYHYAQCGKFLMRSQLDCYDHRLPGNGTFDLKTRAVCAVRYDILHAQRNEGTGYQISKLHGLENSFEREYYDMIRSAFMKYSLQARIGHMDGIFVAFHNIEKIFGFQYISLEEMDTRIHGPDGSKSQNNIADREFKLSIELWSSVLEKLTSRFPEKSMRIYTQAVRGMADQDSYLDIIAEPMDEDEIESIQKSNENDSRRFILASERASARSEPDSSQSFSDSDDQSDGEIVTSWSAKQISMPRFDQKVTPRLRACLRLYVRNIINDQVIPPGEHPNPDIDSKWAIDARFEDVEETEEQLRMTRRIVGELGQIFLSHREDSEYNLSVTIRRLRKLAMQGRLEEAAFEAADNGREKIIWYPSSSSRD